MVGIQRVPFGLSTAVAVASLRRLAELRPAALEQREQIIPLPLLAGKVAVVEALVIQRLPEALAAMARSPAAAAAAVVRLSTASTLERAATAEMV
jgi:hypothetical protein